LGPEDRGICGAWRSLKNNAFSEGKIRVAQERFLRLPRAAGSAVRSKRRHQHKLIMFLSIEKNKHGFEIPVSQIFQTIKTSHG